MVRACRSSLEKSDNPSVVNISSIAGIKASEAAWLMAALKGP
jgi:NADP-dependent 3-hydroxy acid dehydrogenase YdfG